MSHVMCHVSQVTWDVSHVTCHMLHITCDMSHVTYHIYLRIHKGKMYSKTMVTQTGKFQQEAHKFTVFAPLRGKGTRAGNIVVQNKFRTFRRNCISDSFLYISRRQSAHKR